MVKDSISEILEKPVSRRTFNRAIGAGALIATATLSGLGSGKSRYPDVLGKKIDEKYDLYLKRAKGGLERIGFDWEKGKVGGVTIESLAQNPPEGFDLLLPGLTNDEKKVLFEPEVGRILVAGREVLGKFDYGTERGLVNISTLLSLENRIRDKMSITEDKRVVGLSELTPRFLAALAATESGGDMFAESDAGAAGIFQIMPEIGEAMGLTVIRDKEDPDRFTKDQRFNVDDSTDAILQYIADEDGRFRNLGYDLQAVHDGAPNLYLAVKKYVESKHGYNLPVTDFQVDFGSEDANQQEVERQKGLYRGVIDGTLPIFGEKIRPVTIYHLIEDDSTREMFDEEHDLGNQYLYRIIASEMIMNQLKIQIGKLAQMPKAA